MQVPFLQCFQHCAKKFFLVRRWEKLSGSAWDWEKCSGAALEKLSRLARGSSSAWGGKQIYTPAWREICIKSGVNQSRCGRRGPNPTLQTGT